MIKIKSIELIVKVDEHGKEMTYGSEILDTRGYLPENHEVSKITIDSLAMELTEQVGEMLDLSMEEKQMVKLPHEIKFGDFVIRVSSGHHCFRWDILDALDREEIDHGHEQTVAMSFSEAFDWIDTNADYLEES